MSKLKTIDQFNKIASDWLTNLEKKSEEEILINPCEGCWSLSELYDHIIRVARSYQIPNFKKSITAEAERKKRKNLIGFAIFNLGLRKVNKTIKMEKFPKPLVEKLTPKKQNKIDLIKDFKLFIKEVNNLKQILIISSKQNKQYHPMFGDISTKDWLTIIIFHINHHEKQKIRINHFLESRQSE